MTSPRAARKKAAWAARNGAATGVAGSEDRVRSGRIVLMPTGLTLSVEKGLMRR